MVRKQYGAIPLTLMFAGNSANRLMIQVTNRNKKKNRKRKKNKKARSSSEMEKTTEDDRT